MSYRVTIVNDDGELLDEINIDGIDLRRQRDRLFLGEQIADGMGLNAIFECASRGVSSEESKR